MSPHTEAGGISSRLYLLSEHAEPKGDHLSVPFCFKDWGRKEKQPVNIKKRLTHCQHCGILWMLT